MGAVEGTWEYEEDETMNNIGREAVVKFDDKELHSP